jgi:DNA-directed RNA polymerase specialized sigma24 family protein
MGMPIEPARAPSAQRPAAFDEETLALLDALCGFALKLTRVRAWLFTILYHLFVSRRRVAGREVLTDDVGTAGATPCGSATSPRRRIPSAASSIPSRTRRWCAPWPRSRPSLATRW